MFDLHTSSYHAILVTCIVKNEHNKIELAYFPIKRLSIKIPAAHWFKKHGCWDKLSMTFQVHSVRFHKFCDTCLSFFYSFYASYAKPLLTSGKLMSLMAKLNN